MARSLPFKPRNAEATRAALLEAAQAVFSSTSYAQAGIRQIAEKANTSSAMVVRYFGSKAGIFEAAMVAAVPTALALANDRGTFGAFMARALLDPANEIKPPMMMALASGDPEASAIAERVMYEQGVVALADWLGGERARERAMAIAMTATGFALYLRQFDWPRITQGERDVLERWFAGQVQALVDNHVGLA
ncbi:MAG: TetR family transcriptional regulator [Novosphingobium sp.]|nr:TetR family transcriptional regulator [Novosphingobium sp.]